MSNREEPAVPGDPLGTDQPHDVLAAEEFGIGTRDEHIPRDPSGIREAHDVLAADEFPMPAGPEPHEESRGLGPGAWLPFAVLGAIAVVVLRRRR